MCFFLFWKGMDTFTLGMGRQLTSLQFAWPFYESDRTNQAGVPLRPCSMGHMYGKRKLPPSFRRTYVHFGGLLSGGLVSWKDGKWSPYVLSPLDALKSEELRGWEPRRICLSEGCSQCRLGIQVTMLWINRFAFFGCFFCMFFEWFLVGCRGHSPRS